jgi:hypothetical protein
LIYFLKIALAIRHELPGERFCRGKEKTGAVAGAGFSRSSEYGGAQEA